MREILFRAKDKDNGEWVYGSLLIQAGEQIKKDELTPAEYRILGCRGENHLVDPKTVGEYTGLTNEKGTKIFEGDIVKTKYGRLCEVKWFASPCSHCWDLFPIEATHKAPDSYDVWASKNLEVVGNVFDNPKLLEGKA